MTTWLIAFLVAAACTVAAVLTRIVDRSGAVAGFVLAAIFVGLGGVAGFSAFAILVVVGGAASRIGYRAKAAAGVAQEKGGRRGAAHALANAGPAAVYLLLAEVDLVAAVACFGAIAAALSDTISSEVGLLSRMPPRLLLIGRRVKPGADGGMTWLGTLAGALIAAVVAVLTALTSGMNEWILPVLLGGVIGNLVDSILGATVESALPRRHGNEIVNATASTLGGFAALLLHRLVF